MKDIDNQLVKILTNFIGKNKSNNNIFTYVDIYKNIKFYSIISAHSMLHLVQQFNLRKTVMYKLFSFSCYKLIYKIIN